MKNVFLVDDHALFSAAMAKLVDTFSDYKTTHIFKNGAELVDALSKGLELPSIILLDIKMPIMDGLATMKWLKKYKSEAKVLALSMEDDENTVINMIKNGAKGYLLKDIDPEELKVALETVDRQGYYYSENVASILVDSLNGNVVSDNVRLKDNELKFIKLVCEEKKYREIADEMFLSPKTIDGYRQKLFDKLGVKSRTGLVIYAIKHGLVKL